MHQLFFWQRRISSSTLNSANSGAPRSPSQSSNQKPSSTANLDDQPELHEYVGIYPPDVVSTVVEVYGCWPSALRSQSWGESAFFSCSKAMKTLTQTALVPAGGIVSLYTRHSAIIPVNADPLRPTFAHPRFLLISHMISAASRRAKHLSDMGLR